MEFEFSEEEIQFIKNLVKKDLEILKLKIDRRERIIGTIEFTLERKDF